MKNIPAKKIVRNGTFIRDNNGLMDLLNLPFGRIMVIEVEEQVVALTQDDARKYLGELYGNGAISHHTVGQIQKQVEYAQVAQNMYMIARRVNQRRLPNNFHTECFFEKCANCGTHGDLIFNGDLVCEGIDSFDLGLRIVCGVMEIGEMKPLHGLSAVKQMLAAKLPIMKLDGTITDCLLTRALGNFKDELNKMADSIKKRTTTHPPETKQTDNPEPSTITRAPEVPGPEAANSGVNQQM